MSNLPGNPVSPPPVPDSTLGGSVRRHHTIAASSRAAHAGSRLLAEEQQGVNEDEVVDQEWSGGVGAVGEKSSSLHRQSSLPTRYTRVFARAKAARAAGNLTPRTMNSLSAIAAEHGLEGDEEEWAHDMGGWQDDDERGLSVPDVPSAQHQQLIETQSQGSSHSPLSPQFPPNVPSPPPAPSNIRRIQSLNYGAANTGNRIAANLRRSGTLQAQTGRTGGTTGVPNTYASQASNEEEEVEEDAQDTEYQYARQQPNQQLYNQGQYTPTSVGRSSPWGASSNDWRNASGNLSPGLQGNGNGMNANNMFDEVQLALHQLDISNQQNALYQNQLNTPQQQGAGLPPRMNASSIPASLRPGNTGGLGTGNGRAMSQARGGQTFGSGKLLDAEGAKGNGVQPFGHGFQNLQGHHVQGPRAPGAGRDDRAQGQAQNQGGNGNWEQRSLSSRSSNPNLQYSAGGYDASSLPPNPPIPQQYLNQQAGQGPRLNVVSPFQGGQEQLPVGIQTPLSGATGQQAAGFVTAVDPPTLIATKGYNPATFDCKPTFARYFVIKSYTEDDVHKSLKYEIWSSTDPGNKRLDKAFKETAGRGPIYLFFSVNASGHFCGMAEMLTPVDYTRSSTVWASDKWKGVFKVRWIFVRDIPNATLRHIKLNNTQERKPVTNSRDTQELLPDAGQEMLRIFFAHPARTSLLQDFAFYELQAMQKAQAQVQSPGQPQSGAQSPQQTQASAQTQQYPFATPNPYAAQHLAMGPIAPMMQMQMNSPQYSHPHAMQSVMRNPSPIPANTNAGYMGMNSGAF